MGLSDNGKKALGLGFQSAVQAGSGLFGTLIQKKENQLQRNYEREMYTRNLMDTVRLWKMQNEYDSPAMQMERLKQAGLNPNLVYGNGATATGGDMSAPSPSVSNTTRTVNPMEMMGQTSFINQLYDLKLKDAQADLLEQKSTTEQTVQELNAVTSGFKELLQQSEQLKLALGQQTFDDMVKQANLAVQQAFANIANTRSSTRTQQTQQQLNIANTRLSDQNTRTSHSQQELNQLDKKLIEQGYYKTDSGLDRFIKKLMNYWYEMGNQLDKTIPIQRGRR